MSDMADFEGMEMVRMTEEERERVFERFQKELHLRKKKGRFLNRRLAAVCAAALCLFIGGGVISGAMGIGAVGEFFKGFSKNPNDAVVEKNLVVKDDAYQITLTDYYLDALGYGRFLFEVKKADGTDVPGDKKYETSIDYQYGNEKKSYITGSSNPTFFYLDAEEKFSEKPGKDKVFYGMEYDIGVTDGLSKYHPETDKVILTFDGHTYDFGALDVTSEIYEWTDGEGTVSISEMGIGISGNQYLIDYFLNGDFGIGEPVGTVYYKNGDTEKIYFQSGGTNAKGKTAILQFGPVSDELEKKTELKTKSDWEEFDRLFQYQYGTSYFFSLKDMEKIQLGDAVYKISEAKIRK